MRGPTRERKKKYKTKKKEEKKNKTKNGREPINKKKNIKNKTWTKYNNHPKNKKKTKGFDPYDTDLSLSLENKKTNRRDDDQQLRFYAYGNRRIGRFFASFAQKVRSTYL